jgi:molybdopterin synthase catalytic subunit
LDVAALGAMLGEDTDGRHGAKVVFVGTVRGSNAGRSVTHLVYEAYEPLAVRILEKIGAEAEAYWPTAKVVLHHRVGRVRVGEASVAIVAASPHRAEAFSACRYTIERLKQIAPIWKHEFFTGGDVWIEGATISPEDEAARLEAYRRACA